MLGVPESAPPTTAAATAFPYITEDLVVVGMIPPLTIPPSPLSYSHQWRLRPPKCRETLISARNSSEFFHGEPAPPAPITCQGRRMPPRGARIGSGGQFLPDREFRVVDAKNCWMRKPFLSESVHCPPRIRTGMNASCKKCQFLQRLRFTCGSIEENWTDPEELSSQGRAATLDPGNTDFAQQDNASTGHCAPVSEFLADSPVVVSTGEFRQPVTFGVPGSGMLRLRDPDPVSA